MKFTGICVYKDKVVNVCTFGAENAMDALEQLSSSGEVTGYKYHEANSTWSAYDGPTLLIVVMA